MEIINNCSYFLRFRVNKKILSAYQKRWDKLKNICEIGSNKRDVCCKNCGHIQQEYLGMDETTEDIANLWKSQFEMESNKSLIYIDIPEGGMYNPYKRTHQLFFRNKNVREQIIDNDIVIEIINIDQDCEKWTYQELDDLRNGFVKLIIIKVGIEVDSCIEMKFTNTNNDIESEISEYEFEYNGVL